MIHLKECKDGKPTKKILDGVTNQNEPEMQAVYDLCPLVLYWNHRFIEKRSQRLHNWHLGMKLMGLACFDFPFQNEISRNCQF